MNLDKILKSGIPTLFWGPPGVGKSEAIYSFARRNNMPCLVVLLSQYDPVELAGVRFVHEGEVKVAKPDLMASLEKSGGGVLFLDELSCALPSQQSVALRLVRERRLGPWSLPDNTIIVAAANPPEYAAGGFELTAPMANRFKHVQWEVDALEFCKDFPNYWGNIPVLRDAAGNIVPEQLWTNARSVMAGFLSARQQLLLQLPKQKSKQSYAWPSPRTWDMASRELAVHLTTSKILESVLDQIASCIGAPAATEFLQWAREADIPNPEELLKNPCYNWPDKSDIIFAGLSNMVAYVQQSLNKSKDKALWESAWKALSHASDNDRRLDLMAVFASDLVKANKQNNWGYGLPDVARKLAKILL